jgi:hypothetical protein
MQMQVGFEIVMLVIAAIGIAICTMPYFTTSRVLSELGRHDGTWFDRLEDWDPTERPCEDEKDSPLPRKPLRGRPDWY